MRIYLSGSRSVVYSSLQAMVHNGIPFTRYVRYQDGFIISTGSRKVVSKWVYRKAVYAHSYSVLVRKSDLDLIMLSSTAVVTS